ncbi:MAG: trypsin-like peptidase domain-containing protein, partial [Candidatus Auribacterota bacterium]|nr:trypsin-like peptidase domain-containing protein [Candidatus Auribacterota bacterium]
MKKYISGLSIIFSLIFLTPLTGVSGESTPLADLEEEIIRAADRAAPAVVSVSTETISPFWWDELDEEHFPAWIENFLKNDFGSRKRRSAGTGFLISSDGKILTTINVIDRAKKITVVLNDGRVLPARILGWDLIFGIAVLQVEAKDLPFLSLDEGGRARRGAWVIALGQPFGLPTSAALGNVSGLGRTGLGIAPYEELLQITAPINPGDSGGPVLNIRGEVIGIIAGTFTGYREFEYDWNLIRRFHHTFPDAGAISPGYFCRPSQAHGIGFAIPIDLIKDIVEGISNGSSPVYGWLGLYPVAIPGRSGVAVAALTPAGPAFRAGLRKGDIILTIDDREMRSPRELQKLVLFSPAGKELTVKIE